MAPPKKAKKKAKKKVKKKKAKKAEVLMLDDFYDLQQTCQFVVRAGDDVIMVAESAVSEWKRLEPALQKLHEAIESVDRVAMQAARKEIRGVMGEHALDMAQLSEGDDFTRELEVLLDGF